MKKLLKIANEISYKFIEEKLSAREVLAILRELENHAILAMVMEGIDETAKNDKRTRQP